MSGSGVPTKFCGGPKIRVVRDTEEDHEGSLTEDGSWRTPYTGSRNQERTHTYTVIDEAPLDYLREYLSEPYV